MTPVVVRRERIVMLPVDVLWQLVEPVEALPAWLPFVIRSQHLGGQGLGRRQRVTWTWGRRRTDIDQEVIDYRPNQTIAWTAVGERRGPPPTHLSGGVTMRVSMESMGAGTRVVLEAQQTPRSFGAWLGLRLMGRRKILAGFDRALRTLANVGA
ncbi:MAG TPA: SRPBCC family protein [Vicinamibacterales bacterium]